MAEHAFPVRVSAGCLRASPGVELPHPWTPEGVVAAPVSNGAEALHLAVALCVLNDTYREAQRLGVQVDGVAVVASGGFDDQWASTGITWSLEVESPASPDEVESLARVVDSVAEVPKALRAGTTVTRAP
ncbi:osmotically inducible protein OsmC [Nocardioides gansuensis]|uniref:Osmotically inducible protein OsmC n=1 Tax=Nocardioides gansuensis TaxID=2138300 RepID=A0A2T8F7K7_9ACTN|nr:OsmC family protein [Nocardioides gansuensis]PVG81702.1 osmotically inducible protein OsmC [Nocardioides gansuensis]